MQTITFENPKLSYEINEEMKHLRANVQFCGEDKKVLMITSTLENEGKSTTSLELARSLAELGKRVLLIDADMRKSVLQEKMAETNGKINGLSHYLSGQAELEDVVCLVAGERLAVILAGRVPPNPAELLATAKMKKMVEWAKTQFEYVLIDCPPINMVVDAAVVAPYADGCIFVLKANSVPRKLVQNALKQIERTGCQLIGVVMNQVDVKQKGGYYYKKYYSKYKKYEK